jgi:hypothetical protein
MMVNGRWGQSGDEKRVWLYVTISDCERVTKEEPGGCVEIKEKGERQLITKV